MGHLCGHGLNISLPGGWNGHITRREGECALPVLHTATVPLPLERADSGGVVVERLGWNDLFVSLIEHEASAAPTALFSSRGVPVPVSPAWFTRNALQGMRPMQSGAQRFFTEKGRAFCLFVVVGEHARRARLLREVNKMLATLVIERSTAHSVEADVAMGQTP